MAPHDLSLMSNGEAEMFYVGETPWHGLGVKLDSPATSAEAIEFAHLDWEVETQQIYRRTTEETLHKVPDAFALVRTDNGTVLNRCVSGKYEPLQNSQAFQFFDDVIGQGQAVYHTAGALRDGRIVWIMAKMPESYEIVKGDQIDKYIVLSTSHDGSQSLQISTTPIRVVCANTLRVAESRAKHTYRMKHTASIHDRVVEAREALELSNVYFNQMMQGLERLVQVTMTANDVSRFADAVMNVDPEAEKIHTYKDNARTQIFELFYTGRGQDIAGVRDTAYAGFNAVTEYLDNYQYVNAPNAGQTSVQAQDRRLYKTWFARGQDTRNKAYRLLQKFTTDGPSAFDDVYVPNRRNIRGSRYARSS